MSRNLRSKTLLISGGKYWFKRPLNEVQSHKYARPLNLLLSQKSKQSRQSPHEKTLLRLKPHSGIPVNNQSAGWILWFSHCTGRDRTGQTHQTTDLMENRNASLRKTSQASREHSLWSLKPPLPLWHSHTPVWGLIPISKQVHQR